MPVQKHHLKKPPMQIHIRPCQASDLSALQEIAYETYDTTFRPMNRPEVIDAYLGEAFTQTQIASELACKYSHFYFLYCEQVVAGYLKLNEAPSQSDINDPASLEIERIYLRQVHKGKGLGKAMMNHAIEIATELGKDSLWLGVWEKNKAAIQFYKRFGFAVIGQHAFQMGDELQNDFIMEKCLQGTSRRP